MRRLAALFAFAFLFVSAACSPTPNSGSDTGGGDVADDAGADTTDTATPDTETSDTGVDAGDTSGDADADDGGCSLQSDCPDDQICHDGTCRKAPQCGDRSTWSHCVFQISQYSKPLARRAYCGADSRCQVGCVFDKHCADGEVCTDNGECREFESDTTAAPPGGDDQTPLEAGVGQELMHFPIGLSLGGYGSRMKADDGRYVESLRATHGQMHGLYARALALDNGQRRLMFIRLPIIFTSAALHEAVARRLQQETGANWRGSLMISSTHTHSGPARFYHLPEETSLPIGRFGTDTFHDQVFEWLVDGTVAAAKQALENRGPAAAGATVVESFDVDDTISSDRWNQTPQFDDNRLLAMRIDDADSEVPRAVAVSFGTHGTIHSDDYFNGDSLMGFERGLEKALADKYGEYVPVLYFNQNGGTMSPRGGGRGHDGPQRFAKLGADLADKVLDDITGLSTSRSLTLEGTTYRFPITYDLLGYGNDEWGKSTFETVRSNYQYGGLQCSGDPEDSDPSTHIEKDDFTCIPLHQILYHRPPTLFTRSQMSAFRFGEFTFLTAPGELSMELSWQMVRRLKEDHGLDPSKVWTFGFAQDHQFYLNPTNLRGEAPPYPGYRGPKAPKDYPNWAFSYLQGGYEPSMSFWGWRLGDFLADRASRAVAKLKKGDQFQRELPETLPTQFSEYGSEEFPVEPTPDEKVGTVTDQPPATVRRFEPVEFAWIGGDPGVEMPQSPRVVLQRKEGGAFGTVETDRKRPYTNREPVMLTRLRHKNGHPEWVVRWEELRDFPAGTYRFKVTGHHETDERTSYTVESRTFEVKASEDLRLTTSFGGGAIAGTLGYPPARSISYEGTDADPGKVTGNFRLRDPDVPPGAAVPLEIGSDASASDVEIVVEQGGSEVARYSGSEISLGSEARERGGKSGVPTTTFSARAGGDLSAGSYDVTVTVTDTHGNSGTHTTTINVGN